jgi:thiol-disulfide isomerase/thioredoxin
VLLAAVAWIQISAGAPVPDELPCQGTRADDRRACIADWVSVHPPTPDSLRLLSGRVEADPGLVAEIVAAFALPRDGVPASLTADFLELSATALARTGEPARAATEIARAVAHDDGTRRLAWVVPGGSGVWSAPIDVGNGRLVTAARRLLEARRNDDAREWLARAAALGSTEARELSSREFSGVPLGIAWPGAPLRQVAWGPPVPELVVPLHGGGELPLRGDGVLLLDFWASWCQPCRHELPALQRLYDAHKGAGLRAVAVNVDEPEDVAVTAARELGLTLPLGRKTPALASAFRVEELPTLIVADRHGKIRRRWNGYRKGLEQEVADTVRRLLAERESGSVVELASVVRQELPLEVSWVRTGPQPVQALAVIPGRAEVPGTIAVASRDDIVMLEADGAGRWQHAVPFPANELRPFFTSQGAASVAAFRRGSDRLLVLRASRETEPAWAGSVPAAVFDVAPSASGGPMLATLDGLMQWDGASQVRPVSTLGRALALVASPGEDTAWAVLDEQRSVVWLDRERTVSGRTEPIPTADRLVRADGVAGAGVVPAGMLGAAAGRAGTTRWVAVAAPGQLVVLDARDGRELFRAAWPDLSAIAAGDVDGDGQDELAVGSGSQVSLLRVSTKNRHEG